MAIIHVLHDEGRPDSTYRGVKVNFSSGSRTFFSGKGVVKDFEDACLACSEEEHVMLSSDCDHFVTDSSKYYWALTDMGYRIQEKK